LGIGVDASLQEVVGDSLRIYEVEAAEFDMLGCASGRRGRIVELGRCECGGDGEEDNLEDGLHDDEEMILMRVRWGS